MNPLKSLTAIILGLALGVCLMGIVAGIANHRASKWQITVIELQDKLLDMQEELEVYHIDDVKKQVHDMRTWEGYYLPEDDSIEDSLNFNQ